MADISDAINALVGLIWDAIYPSGLAQPSVITLPSGQLLNARVYGGWPLPAQIDADMSAGIPAGSSPVVNVSVFPQAGMERNTTRYPRDWVTATIVPCTLTGTVNGSTVTIGGTVTAGHYLTLHLGNYPFSYAAQAGDTLASVAAALLALIVVEFPTATLTGTVITLPVTLGGRIIVRAAAPGESIREIKRTNQRFLITIWAPNNAARVATAKAIIPVLDSTDYVTLADGYAGELKYESSQDNDRSGKQNFSCRDLYYWVEYPTTQTIVSYPITTFSTGIEIDPETTTIQPLPLSSFTPAYTATD